MNDNRFYVYALLDPRKSGKYEYGDICFLYEPFYIGKGTGNRIYAHSSPSELNRDRNPHKKRKIKKILKQKLEIIHLKIKDNLIETIALALERDYILNIGYNNKRTGPLTNIDEGGINGPVMTKELKLKIRETKKKLYSSGKLVHPWVGRKHTEETKKKLVKNHSNFWTGREHSEKTKNKMSQDRKGEKIFSLYNIYKFTSPLGEEFTVDNGIKLFCEEHDLTYSCVQKVLRKERNHHKQWKCYKIKDNNGGVCKKYKCTSPENQEFIIENGLKTFCESRELQYCNLIKVAQGKRKHHKGWKCEYYNPN